MPALILAALAMGLAFIGVTGAEITQIMSHITALVAMYVVKQAPSVAA
ncbi:hypothetical protein [Nonomuraea soli]|uniref:Uncharacterized protein n=1 Tax=Nonomuraea soli TaxID=1032476 RepID=A0A7W0CPT1_9ACTN|nr:hypothetical protein [Nonomuraea soli]MBA2895096.1 hypothetical protein [Nonomuraea soli]